MTNVGKYFMFFIAGDMNQQGPLTLYVHGQPQKYIRKFQKYIRKCHRILEVSTSVEPNLNSESNKVKVTATLAELAELRKY